MIGPKDGEGSYRTGPTEAWVPPRRPQRDLFVLVAMNHAAGLPVTPRFSAGPARKTKTALPAPQAPGAYFGLRPPGKTPGIFAPGIVSQASRLVNNTAYCSDRSECVSTVRAPNYSSAGMFCTKRVGGAWTPQVEGPFLERYTR